MDNSHSDYVLLPAHFNHGALYMNFEFCRTTSNSLGKRLNSWKARFLFLIGVLLVALVSLFAIPGAYASGFSITVDKLTLNFDGTVRTGSIVTSANGYSVINPGFDLESGARTGGFSGNPDIKLSNYNGVSHFSGQIAPVSPSGQLTATPVRTTLTVNAGDQYLVVTHGGNYVLLTVTTITRNGGIDFVYRIGSVAKPGNVSQDAINPDTPVVAGQLALRKWGAMRTGAIVASADGYTVINPGFDLEADAKTNGWGGNPDLRFSLNNRGLFLSGEIALLPPSNRLAEPLGKGTVTVEVGDRFLVHTHQDHYVLLTVTGASEYGIKFQYQTATTTQILVKGADGGTHIEDSPFNGSAIGGTFDVTPSTEFGTIIFDRATPTGATFIDIERGVGEVGRTTFQLVVADALNPKTGSIAQLSNIRAADQPRFSQDGHKLVVCKQQGLTIYLDGKQQRTLTAPIAILGGVKAAHWSPDGRFLAFQGGGHGNGYVWNSGSLYVADTNLGLIRTVVNRQDSKITVNDVHWLPQGGLVFSGDDAFYIESATLQGYRKLPLNPSKLSNSGKFAVSPNGLLLAWTAPDKQGTDQVWIGEVNGKITQLTSGRTPNWSPVFSPGGNMVAYVAQDVLHTVTLQGEDHMLVDVQGRPISLAKGIEQWIPGPLSTLWTGK